MASQAFPPTPGGQPAPRPNPVGTAVAGAPAKANPQQLVAQAGAGLQAFAMLAKMLAQSKPEVAQKFTTGITAFQEGIQMLKGGAQPAPTAPQGQVPPPPQMAAESPEQTPEAT